MAHSSLRLPLDHVVSVANQIFSQEGFGTPLREIAHAMDRREGDLLESIGTKGNLLLMAMAPAPDRVEEAIQNKAPAAHHPRCHLKDVAVVALDYYRDLAPILLALSSDLTFEYDEFARRYPSAPHLVVEELLMGFLRDLAAQGWVQAAHLESAGTNLISFLFTTAVFEALGAYRGRAPEAAVHAQIDLLWSGMGTLRSNNPQ